MKKSILLFCLFTLFSFQTSFSQNKENEKEVPFTIIDDVPIYPSCTGTNEELKKCFMSKISQHVAANFNVGIAKKLKLPLGKVRISVMFKINKHGKITDVKARAPHKKLKKEAIRVVKKLPRMTLGKLNGKNVAVRYALPIVFMVEQ